MQTCVKPFLISLGYTWNIFLNKIYTPRNNKSFSTNSAPPTRLTTEMAWIHNIFGCGAVQFCTNLLKFRRNVLRLSSTLSKRPQRPSIYTWLNGAKLKEQHWLFLKLWVSKNHTICSRPPHKMYTYCNAYDWRKLQTEDDVTSSTQLRTLRY
jgi:hypothetical protein